MNSLIRYQLQQHSFISRCSTTETRIHQYLLRKEVISCNGYVIYLHQETVSYIICHSFLKRYLTLLFFHVINSFLWKRATLYMMPPLPCFTVEMLLLVVGFQSNITKVRKAPLSIQSPKKIPYASPIRLDSSSGQGVAIGLWVASRTNPLVTLLVNFQWMVIVLNFWVCLFFSLSFLILAEVPLQGSGSSSV